MPAAGVGASVPAAGPGLPGAGLVGPGLVGARLVGTPAAGLPRSRSPILGTPTGRSLVRLTATVCHVLSLLGWCSVRAREALHDNSDGGHRIDGPHRQKDVRRRPTLPHPVGCSTIGAGWLNFRVRDGSGCFPAAMAAV